VQIAKALGAEVAGVCSTRNVEMVRSLGADRVFDYTREDFTRSGERYDLILDNVSSRSFSDLRRALTPQGQIIPNSGYGGMGYVLRAFALAPFLRQLQAPLMAEPTGKDLDALSELVAAGKLAPVIDRTYSLAETAAALRYFADEHPRGKVVITVAA
jgi:NADPH:quinone reductase-like Zn-dependent oxidoreductase